MGGCAPIPGASTSGGQASAPAPLPTGEWETRWGAIAEDPVNLATGASVSRKSEGEAAEAAMQECQRQGGSDCKLRIAYHNQCVAFADPTMESRKTGRWTSIAYSARTKDLARAMALKRCEAYGSGHECTVVYSACSMSEFKRYR